MVTLDDHLNAAMKLRQLQSFTSLFAWARKSCANDRKATKILACNDGEKKRPPPHVHIKWQRFRHYGCIVYSTLLSFSTGGTNKQMEEIFLNAKNIFSPPSLCKSRHIGPWHNQHLLLREGSPENGNFSWLLPGEGGGVSSVIRGLQIDIFDWDQI